MAKMISFSDKRLFSNDSIIFCNWFANLFNNTYIVAFDVNIEAKTIGLVLTHSPNDGKKAVRSLFEIPVKVVTHWRKNKQYLMGISETLQYKLERVNSDV